VDWATGSVTDLQVEKADALRNGCGLSRMKNGRSSRLLRERVPCNPIHWMIQDDDHSLWLYTHCGLVTPVLPTTGATLREWVGIGGQARCWPARRGSTPTITSTTSRSRRRHCITSRRSSQAKIFELMVPSDVVPAVAAARRRQRHDQDDRVRDFEKLELLSQGLTAIAVPRRTAAALVVTSTKRGRSSCIAQAFARDARRQAIIVVANSPPQLAASSPRA